LERLGKVGLCDGSFGYGKIFDNSATAFAQKQEAVVINQTLEYLWWV
jgi:hypothetical protein